MKKIQLLVLLFLFFCNAFAQNSFNIFHPGGGSYGATIINSGTNKFGALVSSYASSESLPGMIVAKLNNQLLPEWSTLITDSVRTFYPFKIKMTACRNGGIAFTIPNEINGSYKGFYVIKTTGTGALLWAKLYNGDGNTNNAIAEAPDGSLAVATITTAGLTVLRLNGANGNVIKATAFTAQYPDYHPTSIAITKDSGYIVGGYLIVSYNYFVAVKYSKRGAIQWMHTYQLAPQGPYYWQSAESIAQTSDGGYVFSGQCPSLVPGNGYDAGVVKLDATGNVQWAKQTGTPNEDGAESIVQSVDSAYTLTTTTYVYGPKGTTDVFAQLMHIDKTGKHLWSTTINDNAITQRNNVVSKGIGYVVAGTYSNKLRAVNQGIYIATVGSNGETCQGSFANYHFMDMPLTRRSPKIIVSDATNSITAESAAFYAIPASYKAYNKCAGEESPSSRLIATTASLAQQEEVKMYPNPATNMLRVTAPPTKWGAVQITITDINGKRMYTTKVAASTKETIAVRDWANGMYIVTVTDGKQTKSYKIIKTSY